MNALTAAAGGSLIVVQVVRAIWFGGAMTHYTSVNFLVAGLFLVAMAWQPPAQQHIRGYIALHVAPFACASTAFVAVATAAMFEYHAGIVDDARRRYPAWAVHLANLVLHGLPAAVVLGYTTWHRARLRADIVAVTGPWLRERWIFWSMAYASICYLVWASYFYVIHITTTYEVALDENAVRTTCMTLLLAALLLATSGVLGHFELLLPRRFRQPSRP